MSHLRPPPPPPPAHESFTVTHGQPNDDPRTTPASLAVLFVLGLLAAHRVLAHYDISPREIPELFWNCFVYIMPAPLVFALGTPSISVDNDTTDDSAEAKARRQANLFAAKNEVLRRTFGLDGTGMLKAFSGDRTLRAAGLITSAKDAVPPGLGNWDNSCYQNSVIQGLASLPSLQGFLENGIQTFDSLASDSTNGALLDTVLKLNNPENHNRYLWTPAKLKSMSSWQQQDAQEYFSKVLDEIDKEVLKELKQSRKIAGLEEVPSIDEEKAASPAVKVEPVTYPESLRNPLEGLLAQRVGCMNCGFTEGLSMIPFNCLTVPLQTAWGYGCDIRDCLNEYTKLEPIEGVECAKCTLLKARGSMENLLKDREESEPSEPTKTFAARLKAVQDALEDEDFADATLIKKCQIPRKNWVSSTKSRQAVVGRAPKSLVIHVNRSVFDEMTGAQRKNYATVTFPDTLDLGPWALGSSEKPESKEFYVPPESWSTRPTESMISPHKSIGTPTFPYELRAVVTHYGRHENGHYVCYRKHPFKGEETKAENVEDPALDADEEGEVWWRLSDEDVSRVSKEDVLAQGGVFMLFYEAKEIPSPPSPVPSPLLRRSSTATIRAVAASSAPVETYEPVQEQEDEEYVEGDEALGDLADGVPAPHRGIPLEKSLNLVTGPVPRAYHRTTESMETTPPKSDSESDLEPASSPSSYNSELEDTVVLSHKRHNRDRNSTISNASSASFNYPPTPLSPLSLSPTASEMRTPFAEQQPIFPNPTFTRQDMDTESEHQPLASPLFSPNALATPVAVRSPNLDPVARAVIEGTIKEEEGDARWTTSRSEYAPSTVGGTESEYAPSSTGGYASDADGPAWDSEAGEGFMSEREPDSPTIAKKEPMMEPQPQPHRQSLTLRTAQAPKGDGTDGDGAVGGLEGQGLRMVAAT